MNRRMAVLLIAGLVLLAGCQAGSGNWTWTPEARLLAARESFNGAVNALAMLREQGAFTRKEADTIGFVIGAGQRLLDRLDAAVELGQPIEGLAREFNTIIRELVAARKQGERARARAKAAQPTTAPAPTRAAQRTAASQSRKERSV